MINMRFIPGQDRTPLKGCVHVCPGYGDMNNGQLSLNVRTMSYSPLTYGSTVRDGRHSSGMSTEIPKCYPLNSQVRSASKLKNWDSPSSRMVKYLCAPVLKLKSLSGFRSNLAIFLHCS